MIQIAAIDRLRRLGHDADGESILGLVVNSFRHEAASWSDEMRTSLASGDLAVIQRIAHTLRGSASVLGATRLAEICGELEICADGGDTEGCELQLVLVGEVLSEVLSALSKVEPVTSQTPPSHQNPKKTPGK